MAITTKEYDNTNQVGINVRDVFKGKLLQEIRDTLDLDRSEMITVCMNLSSDFNKASVIRANNAFLGREVILVGRKKFDARGTVGTHRYEHLKISPTVDEIFPYLREQGYTIFAVDNTPDYNPEVIYDVDLPVKSAFIYGEEQAGLSEDIVAQCDKSIYIPQYGSVRSLNISQAAAVVMSEYSRRFR